MSLRSIIQQKRSEDIIDIIGKDLYVEFRKGDNISLPQPIVTSIQQLNKINPILTTAFLNTLIDINICYSQRKPCECFKFETLSDNQKKFIKEVTNKSAQHFSELMKQLSSSIAKNNLKNMSRDSLITGIVISSILYYNNLDIGAQVSSNNVKKFIDVAKQMNMSLFDNTVSTIFKNNKLEITNQRVKTQDLYTGFVGKNFVMDIICAKTLPTVSVLYGLLLKAKLNGKYSVICINLYTMKIHSIVLTPQLIAKVKF